MTRGVERPGKPEAFRKSVRQSRSERKREVLTWTAHISHVAESRRHADTRVLY
jgi:hypothetical protein